jgi:nucleotide-binding universal stress UspA family protein
MKVMIAVDGSDGSFAAVDQMGRVLAAETDEVALYCSPPEVRLRTQPPEPKLLARAQQGIAEAIFAEARKRLPDALQARAHTIVDARDARHGLVLEADAWSADMIAVGARGLSTLERLLLGSVSRAVVHESKIPVWVARQMPGRPRRTSNVLLACENPELGRAAADLLAKFTWPDPMRFSSISVVESIFAGRVPDWLEQRARGPDVESMVQAWAKEHEEDLQACRSCMEEFVGQMAPPLNRCRALVVEGEPAREILAAIHKEEIDLAVIGSQHKRTVASIILGSTSEAVLNHSGCSMLVVPNRASS